MKDIPLVPPGKPWDAAEKANKWASSNRIKTKLPLMTLSKG